MKIILRPRIIGIFLSLLVLCSCETADSIRPELPAEVHFSKDAGRGDWLYLTLRLENGDELLFNVDTGAPVTVLDKSLEPKLGKRLSETTVRYAWKEVTGHIYAAPKLYLGKTRLIIGDRVWTDELSRNLNRTNHIRPVMGILGMDCLRHYCVQLDFAAGRMRFLDPDHLETAALGKTFPLTLHPSGYVTIRENFTRTKDVTPIIDTGCLVDGVLEPKEFDLELREQKAAWTNQFKDATGFSRCTAFFSKAVFGGETYADVFMDKAPAMLWKGRPHYVNAIGLPFLARHLVTFNFPKKTMYLQRHP
jgi:hypothetical protein